MWERLAVFWRGFSKLVRETTPFVVFLGSGISVGFRSQRHAVGGIFAELLWPVADGDARVQMLIDGDAAAVHRTPPALFVYLQSQVPVFHGIIAIYGSLGLNRKDAVEILADAGNES